MFRRILREIYMLPRWEQRALILLSLLMILSLAARLVSRSFPAKEPESLEEFAEEARILMKSYGYAHFSNQGWPTGENPVRDSLPGSNPSGEKTVLPVVPEVETSSFREYRYRSEREPPDTVRINEADSSELIPLPGIGPVLAGRIIKYRDLLGGFVSADQLARVYGLKKETLERIRGFMVFDTSHLHKLDINRAGFRELLRHPYLQYDEVRALMEYRDFNPFIHSPDEIRESRIWPDSTLDRIAPYLLFDP